MVHWTLGLIVILVLVAPVLLSGTAAEHLKLRTWLALATALALIAFVFYEAAIAVRLWRVLPFMDQWEAVPLYQLVMNHPWSILQLLFHEHNEHRLPLTKLAFLVDFALFDARSTFVLPLLLMLHVLLGVALGLVASRHFLKSERLVAVMLGVAFMLSPLQIENLARPFHSGWALCGILSLVAFYSTARLAEVEEHHASQLVLPVLSTVGAVYAAANGLASAFIVFVLAWVLPLSRFARVAVAGAAILSVATFFIGYDFAPQTVPYHASFRSWHGLAKFALYICAFFGSIVDFGGLVPAIAVGAVGLTFWAVLTTSRIVQFYRRSAVDAAAVALLALATASVATALMTAIGRRRIFLGAGVVFAIRHLGAAVLVRSSRIGSQHLCRSHSQREARCSLLSHISASGKPGIGAESNRVASAAGRGNGHDCGASVGRPHT